MPTKLIVFDCDNTIVSTKDLHFKAFNEALSIWCSTTSFKDFTITEDEEDLYNGLPTTVKLDLLTKNKRLPIESYKTVERLKQEFTIKFIKEKIKATDYVHIHDLLKHLKTKGYIVYCASNCSSETLNLMLDLGGYSHLFDRIFSNRDVIKPKPDPEIYLKCSYLAGVHPYETIVVEDADKGIIAAKFANTNVLEVKSPEDVTLDKVITFINECDDKLDRYLGK